MAKKSLHRSPGEKTPVNQFFTVSIAPLLPPPFADGEESAVVVLGREKIFIAKLPPPSRSPSPPFPLPV